MTAKPGAAMPNEAADPKLASHAASKRKPRIAFFIATACGIGYIPVAPGTWGSLVGCVVWVFSVFYFPQSLGGTSFFWAGASPFSISCCALAIAAAGVWASDRTAKFSKTNDPQFVVIDEVSGQYLSLVLGIAFPTYAVGTDWLFLSSGGRYVSTMNGRLKYMLLGFILFRLFDIWKPFPARQAESLPGGWGIMADDWVAGIYAAIGLWLARAAGL